MECVIFSVVFFPKKMLEVNGNTNDYMIESET